MKSTKLARVVGGALLAAGTAITMMAPASLADTTEAPRSAVALAAAQVKLDRGAESRPESVTGWYVDQATDKLVVEVYGTDAGVAKWADRLGAGEVSVKHVAEAPQPMWNIIGGQAITTSGSRCSAGFNARNSSGTRFVITAGHCTNIGSSWNGTGGTLGTRQASSFPTNDYGTIRVTSSSATSTALVDRYSAGSDVAVTGAATATVGMAVCRSGSTTGWHCGSVTGTNQTVCYSQGCVYQMIRTNVCAEPGDSGGALVTNSGSRRALGLTSGGSGNCRTGGTTYYQTVTEVLSTQGLTLYTG